MRKLIPATMAFNMQTPTYVYLKLILLAESIICLFPFLYFITLYKEQIVLKETFCREYSQSGKVRERFANATVDVRYFT